MEKITPDVVPPLSASEMKQGVNILIYYGVISPAKFKIRI